jgi:hypothetical protein
MDALRQVLLTLAGNNESVMQPESFTIHPAAAGAAAAAMPFGFFYVLKCM